MFVAARELDGAGSGRSPPTPFYTSRTKISQQQLELAYGANPCLSCHL